jgi:hypothetical protein
MGDSQLKIMPLEERGSKHDMRDFLVSHRRTHGSRRVGTVVAIMSISKITYLRCLARYRICVQCDPVTFNFLAATNLLPSLRSTILVMHCCFYALYIPSIFSDLCYHLIVCFEAAIFSFVVARSFPIYFLSTSCLFQLNPPHLSSPFYYLCDGSNTSTQ